MKSPIETSRLRIRKFEGCDIDAVSRLLDDCFGPAPREQREAWLDWTTRNCDALADLGQPAYGDYAITLRRGEPAGEGDTLIGSVGLVPSFAPFETLPWFRARLRPGHDVPGERSARFTPEMGLFWSVHSEHRRAGYATEAARALATFAFDNQKADRLVATTEQDNAASIAVMKNLGMRIEKNPNPEPAWFQVVGILEGT